MTLLHLIKGKQLTLIVVSLLLNTQPTMAPALPPRRLLLIFFSHIKQTVQYSGAGSYHQNSVAEHSIKSCS